jgi:hypothetical protein
LKQFLLLAASSPQFLDFLIFTSPKEANNMPRPKKVIVLPESQIQDSLTNGRVTVAMLATAAGCSVPTMRKHLAEAFGDRITFSRGRTGGITLTAPVTVEESTAS